MASTSGTTTPPNLARPPSPTTNNNSTTTASPILSTHASSHSISTSPSQDDFVSLLQAIRIGNFENVKQILYRNPECANKTYKDLTVIMFALESNREDIAIYLIENGFGNVHHKTTNNQLSALHLAAWKGFDLAIAAIVDAGVSLKETTSFHMIEQFNYPNLTALHISAAFGHEKAVKTLVLLGADLNALVGASSWTYTPAALAKAKKRVDVANMLNTYMNDALKLTKESKDFQMERQNRRITALTDKVNHIQTSVNNLFLEIVRQGKQDCVMLMIENGVADINAKDADEKTALAIACSNPTTDHAAIVRHISLARGVNFKLTDSNKQNALHHLAIHFPASGEQNMKCALSMFRNIIYQLKNDDISLFNEKDTDGWSAMHIAIKKNLLMIFEEMNGNQFVHWNQKNHQNQNALHLLVIHYDPSKTMQICNVIARQVTNEAFKLMVNTIDTLNYSPLLLAIKHDNAVLVEYFLGHCDLSIQYDTKGYTCIQYLIQATEDKPNARAILEKILDHARTSGSRTIDLQDKEGNSAVHIAIKVKKIWALKMLLRYGPDLNLRNQQGFTALHMAINNDDKHSMELLVENGADVNFSDEEGNTPLHLAVKKSSDVICDFLVTRCANLHAENQAKLVPSQVATVTKNYRLRMQLDKAFLAPSDLEDYLKEQKINTMPSHPGFQGVEAVNRLGTKVFLVNRNGKPVILKHMDNRDEAYRRQLDVFSKLKQHPHLIEVLAKDNPSGLVIMEYMNRGTLQDMSWSYLGKQVTLQTEHLKKIGAGLVAALKALHAASIDPILTPRNVYFDWNYDMTRITVKVGIFGSIEETDRVYLAPEELKALASDHSHSGEQQDVASSSVESSPATTTTTAAPATAPSWSHLVARFGILMNTIVSGRRPYSELNLVQVLTRASKGVLGKPEIAKECPEGLKVLLERCWHDNVTERPSIDDIEEMMSSIQ